MNIEKDEVLRRALRAHDAPSIEQLRADSPYGASYKISGGGIFPTIDIDHLHHPQHMKITWWRDGKVVSYESDPEGEIVTVRDSPLPDAVLSGMSGRPLSEVVAIPGCEDRIVDLAVNSKAFVSDPLDLRISLIPN